MDKFVAISIDNINQNPAIMESESDEPPHSPPRRAARRSDASVASIVGAIRDEATSQGLRRSPRKHASSPLRSKPPSVGETKFHAWLNKTQATLSSFKDLSCDEWKEMLNMEMTLVPSELHVILRYLRDQRILTPLKNDGVEEKDDEQNVPRQPTVLELTPRQKAAAAHKAARIQAVVDVYRETYDFAEVVDDFTRAIFDTKKKPTPAGRLLVIARMKYLYTKGQALESQLKTSWGKIFAGRIASAIQNLQAAFTCSAYIAYDWLEVHHNNCRRSVAAKKRAATDVVDLVEDSEPDDKKKKHKKKKKHRIKTKIRRLCYDGPAAGANVLADAAAAIQVAENAAADDRLEEAEASREVNLLEEWATGVEIDIAEDAAQGIEHGDVAPPCKSQLVPIPTHPELESVCAKLIASVGNNMVVVMKTEKSKEAMAMAPILGWGGFEASRCGLSSPEDWVMLGPLIPLTYTTPGGKKKEYDLSKVGLLEPRHKANKDQWIAASPNGVPLSTLEKVSEAATYCGFALLWYKMVKEFSHIDHVV
jgi:hypothetical protein